MAHLAKLKFSDKQRSQVKMTVEERLRHKLIDRLKEQKELAEAHTSVSTAITRRAVASANLVPAAVCAMCGFLSWRFTLLTRIGMCPAV